jgi:peptide chain release factor
MPVDEKTIIESFSRASGPGGQRVNKVSTRVTLIHIPTGLQVHAQSERSQQANRRLARQRLNAFIEGHQKARQQRLLHERERRRRQQATRPQPLKRRFIESKRRRGALKSLRGRVRSHEDS